MAGFLGSLLDRYRDEVRRNETRPFLEGVMAACALVAAVDGRVSLPERMRVDQVMGTLEALKVFDPHEGVDLFNEYADALLASPREGHDKAVAAVKAAAETPDVARLLIRVCLAVSEADADGGRFIEDQIEIVSLCSLLGVDPDHFGLYTDAGLDGLSRHDGRL